MISTLSPPIQISDTVYQDVSSFDRPEKKVKSPKSRLMKGKGRRKKQTKRSGYFERSRELELDDLDLDLDGIPFFDEEVISLDEFDTLKKTTKGRKERAKRNAEELFENEDAEQNDADQVVVLERRSSTRRVADRDIDAQFPGVERRKKVQRRRQIDPTTCERDYSQEEVEFMNALDDYKRNSGRMFPTCSEILEVLRALGYEKVKQEEAVVVESVPVGSQTILNTTEPATESLAPESKTTEECVNESESPNTIRPLLQDSASEKSGPLPLFEHLSVTPLFLSEETPHFSLPLLGTSDFEGKRGNT